MDLALNNQQCATEPNETKPNQTIILFSTSHCIFIALFSFDYNRLLCTDITVSVFELQYFYHCHCWTNTPGKSMDLLIPKLWVI